MLPVFKSVANRLKTEPKDNGDNPPGAIAHALSGVINPDTIVNGSADVILP